MVRMKKNVQETRTVYYMKPGQTLENTKVSERSLALIVPTYVYERFCDNTSQSEKYAILAEREAKRIAALREASYNMSKTWDDTPQNIQRRRKEELLSRKKLEEAERIKFTKEQALKNAAERAEVVKQAKELLLYRNPNCRLINKALLVSECLRELDEQVKFDNLMKERARKYDEDHAKKVLEDVEKFREEEKIKAEARMAKILREKHHLDRQILDNKQHLQKLKDSTMKAEKEDLQNMSKEIESMKQKELQEELRKKESLKKMFLENIEEKRRSQLRVREEEEFQEKNLKLYSSLKQQMDKLMKENTKKLREQKFRKCEKLALRIGGKMEKKKASASKKGNAIQEKIQKEFEEQRKMEDLKKIEDQRQKKEKARMAMLEQMKNDEKEREKRKKEEMDLLLWETLQRYKRVECDKEWNLQNLQREKNKRLHYGSLLKIQMAQNDARRKKEMIEADDSIDSKEIINTANEKVLAYGERVLSESRGVRPLYPIVKVIENFKREAGLIPYKSAKEYEHPKISKRKRGKRQFCNKPVSEENILYLS